MNRYIASFLNNQDKVILSGVNHAAFNLFSNKLYFKLVFRSDHPALVKSPVFNDKQCVIQYLCDRHPTNCWKVLSCMFQTGIFTFSRSFLSEAIPFEIEKLKKERATLQAQLNKTTPLLDGTESEIKKNLDAIEKSLSTLENCDRSTFVFKNEEININTLYCRGLKRYTFEIDRKLCTPPEKIEENTVKFLSNELLSKSECFLNARPRANFPSEGKYTDELDASIKYLHFDKFSIISFEIRINSILAKFPKYSFEEGLCCAIPSKRHSCLAVA